MKSIIYKKHLFLFFLLLLLICKTTFAQWSKVNMIDSVPWSRPTSFIIGDTIYMGRGDTGFFQYSKAFFGYTTSSEIWHYVPGYPGQGSDWGFAFVINNRAYVGGGAGYGFFSDFWKSSPSTGWSSLGASNAPGGIERGYSVGLSMGSKGYVGTGGNFSTELNDFWEYDTLSNSWTQKANFPSARQGCAGFVANGYIYIGLGTDGNTTFNDMYRYDTLNDVWDTMAPMPTVTGMEEPGYFTLCGKLIVTAGDTVESDGRSSQHQAWLFDPTIKPKGRWHRLPDFAGPQPRYAPGGFALNDTGYIYGGLNVTPNNSYIYRADMYRFVPTALLMSMIVSPTDTTICAGNSVTLNGSGATSYLWNTTDTTFSVTITPKKDTLYTVSETNGTCVFIDTVAVHVSSGPAVAVTPDPAAVCSGQTILLTASGGTTYQWVGTTDAYDTISVHPAKDTTYELRVSTGSCTTDTFITVNVNAAATLNVLPQAPYVCSGTGVILVGNGDAGDTYSWTPATGLSATTGDSVTANPSATITYTVIATAPGGCSDTGTDVINVIPAPNKPTITVSVTGDSLISSAGSYNQWYFNGQLTDSVRQVFVIKGHTKGWYYVTVTNPANGCTTTSDSTTSINQLALIRNQLSIYPNPFNNNIFIKVSSSALNVSQWSLQVTDVLGRTLYVKSSLGYDNEIDLSSLPNAVYYITVINKTARAVYPIVKQN